MTTRAGKLTSYNGITRTPITELFVGDQKKRSHSLTFDIIVFEYRLKSTKYKTTIGLFFIYKNERSPGPASLNVHSMW